MSDIVTLTLNPAIDRSLWIQSVTPDSKLRCDSPRRDPGGGGVNVCRTVQELGGGATAIWTKGGYTGEMFEQLLDEIGVSHLPVPVAGMTRDHLIVHERATGRSYRFQEPGPVLSDEEAARCLRTVSGLEPPPGYLVLSGSLPQGVAEDFYAQVVRAAPDETRIVIDTTPDALRPALEEGVHLLKPNARELAELAGRTVEGTQQIMEVSGELVAAGQAEIVVTSLAAGGAIVVAGEVAEHLIAPSVRVESRVGAGDSMVAGLVLGLARGWEVLRAVRLGIAAGAAAVMDPDTGLGSRENAERLFSQMEARAS
ncbi:MAG: 1-phosphofructokinase family hexose kinase [Armatimonadota bacterium]|nr:1-phosphofructokinase family hexose kinase [Armatimonadota bacterium]